jgi:pimeloyl-ACP methyl ester carboxylesterase
VTIGNPTQITRDGLAFDVYESGPAEGEPVVLLHGFPQFSDSWDAVVPLLNQAGYRTITMDQRGYSPGARPRGRRRYTVKQLVADAAALLDHAGGSAHVVGHDWGAVVAWGLATSHPEKVRTLTAVSVPHPQAFLTSFVTSAQALKSWYMFFFQLPWLPEKLLTAPRAGAALVRGGQSREHARRDAGRLAGPALTGPLNWYRAMPFGDLRAPRGPVRVPTLLVWSDGDVAVGRAAVDTCGKYVRAPYRLEVLNGVSHWIPDEAPAELAALLLPHLQQ